MNKAVGLLRVSTKRQAKSRWGLEAQHHRINEYKRLTGTNVLKVCEEIVSGKEHRANRPVLNRIIRYCRKHDAFILIATLDRLARNVRTILYLLESDVKIVVADMPFANRWQILRKAVDDEEEGYTISERTSRGLQEAKKNGVELGKNGKVLAEQNRQNANAFALTRMPDVERERANGYASEGKLMRRFNSLGILSPRGGQWHPATIHALLKRIERLKSKASNENQENTILSQQKSGK